MTPSALSVRADQESQSLDMRAVMNALQQRIGPQKYNAWFRHGTSVTLVDGHVRVAVPNPFVASWIEGHYQGDIAAVVESLTGQNRPVVVSVDPNLTGTLRRRALDRQAEMVGKVVQGRGRTTVPQGRPALRHQLEDFVVGACNRLAYTAARAMLNDGEAPFHALFLHGSCGVGKTHLLQGLCNAAEQRGQALRWRYVTGEQFTNEFVQALREKRFAEFRERYRRLDFLAIDDVHFLASKKAIQEEFLHTFDAIEAKGRHVVLASDAHPKMVGELNEQLASRFVSGMVVKMDQPDYDTRVAVLSRRVVKMGLQVSPDVVEYVAQHIRASFRELEGALLKLAAVSALAEGPVTLAMARDTLAEYLSQTDSSLTLADIETAVSAYFGITPADIHSSRRTRTISTARSVAMLLARRHTQMSYPEIGRFMGKNHSSVVLAVQRVERLLAGEADLNWTTPAGKKARAAETILREIEEHLS